MSLLGGTCGKTAFLCYFPPQQPLNDNDDSEKDTEGVRSNEKVEKELVPVCDTTLSLEHRTSNTDTLVPSMAILIR